MEKGCIPKTTPSEAVCVETSFGVVGSELKLDEFCLTGLHNNVHLRKEKRGAMSAEGKEENQKRKEVDRTLSASFTRSFAWRAKLW